MVKSSRKANCFILYGSRFSLSPLVLLGFMAGLPLFFVGLLLFSWLQGAIIRADRDTTLATTPETQAMNADPWIEFNAASRAEVETVLRDRSNDGRSWVVTVTFGLVRAMPYRVASAIPYDAVGDTYQFDHRYWRDGAWREFSEAKRIRYENSNLGVAD